MYVVGPDQKPTSRPVELGAVFGGMRVVRGGVKHGDLVVVDGLQRVTPGQPVKATVLPVDDEGLPLTRGKSASRAVVSQSA